MISSVHLSRGFSGFPLTYSARPLGSKGTSPDWRWPPTYRSDPRWFWQHRAPMCWNVNPNRPRSRAVSQHIRGAGTSSHQQAGAEPTLNMVLPLESPNLRLEHEARAQVGPSLSVLRRRSPDQAERFPWLDRLTTSDSKPNRVASIGNQGYAGFHRGGEPRVAGDILPGFNDSHHCCSHGVGEVRPGGNDESEVAIRFRDIGRLSVAASGRGVTLGAAC